SGAGLRDLFPERPAPRAADTAPGVLARSLGGGYVPGLLCPALFSGWPFFAQRPLQLSAGVLDLLRGDAYPVDLHLARACSLARGAGGEASAPVRGIPPRGHVHARIGA